jgi:hypothetical protein
VNHAKFPSGLGGSLARLWRKAVDFFLQQRIYMPNNSTSLAWSKPTTDWPSIIVTGVL